MCFLHVNDGAIAKCTEACAAAFFLPLSSQKQRMLPHWRWWGGERVESDVFKRYQQKRVRGFKNDVGLATNTVSELHSPGPEPKRPGHTSFLLFIKTQITNITLFPLLILLEPEEIYSSWMLLPTTEWDSSVKDQHFINSSCVWAMYGSERE